MAISDWRVQENVDMMANYMGLDKFKAIYVVDLCTSLCKVAQAKVIAKGWKNVHVIEADACKFQPPEGTAQLVTFSYSLTSEFSLGSLRSETLTPIVPSTCGSIANHC